MFEDRRVDSAPDATRQMPVVISNSCTINLSEAAMRLVSSSINDYVSELNPLAKVTEAISEINGQIASLTQPLKEYEDYLYSGLKDEATSRQERRHGTQRQAALSVMKSVLGFIGNESVPDELIVYLVARAVRTAMDAEDRNSGERVQELQGQADYQRLIADMNTGLERWRSLQPVRPCGANVLTAALAVSPRAPQRAPFGHNAKWGR